MSFDWNLSSDEEGGFDNWANVDLQASLKPMTTTHLGKPQHDDTDDDSESDSDIEKEKGIATVAFFEEDEDDSDEDDDGIDWEDADEDDGAPHEMTESADSKLAANAASVPLKPVTVDWTKNSNQNKKKKAKKLKARRSYRFEHLPPDMQVFLANLEKTHLLSLTSHALHVSQFCSRDEVLHVVHSLIPETWLADDSSCAAAPTITELRDFCNWFFDLVNHTEQRRRQTQWANRRAGAPARRGKKRKGSNNTNTNATTQLMDGSIRYHTLQYCSYLSRTHDEDPQLLGEDSQYTSWTNPDKVQLLVSMARSLGWRARYVMALEPLKRDLDVNHPIFAASNVKNVFQRVWKEGRKGKAIDNDGGGKMPATRARRSKESTTTTKKPVKTGALDPSSSSSLDDTTTSIPTTSPVCWVEILCRYPEKKRNRREHHKTGDTPKMRWIHVEPGEALVNRADLVETLLYARSQDIPLKQATKKVPIAYALAAEHVLVSNCMHTRLTDVTPRYASSWIESLKARGVLRGKQTRVKESERVDKWWTSTLKSLNEVDDTNSKPSRQELISKGNNSNNAISLDASSDDEKKPAAKTDPHIDDINHHEKEELLASEKDEPLPTSKTAFKSHPVYAVPSVLNQNEVIVPDAKSRICGVFKGELVYRRTDIRVALPSRKWPYKGFKVKASEEGNPIKRVKARKKPMIKGFKALTSYGVGKANDGSENSRLKEVEMASQPLGDGMEDIYAPWQTDPWSPPPVAPDGRIPVNDFNNVELELLNPGLVHIDQPRVALVAKQLGIPYAPCLLGFEGHGGNRTPTIRGIVVHEHNEEILREAHVEMASQFLEQSHENRQHAIYLRWKKLLVGVLTKDRLERAYGPEG